MFADLMNAPSGQSGRIGPNVQPHAVGVSKRGSETVSCLPKMLEVMIWDAMATRWNYDLAMKTIARCGPTGPIGQCVAQLVEEARESKPGIASYPRL